MTNKEALRDLRKDATKHLDHHIKYLNDRLDVIEKDLKVLEILKKEPVELIIMTWVKKVDGYISFRIESEIKQEEFELLKEWLENGKIN